MAVLHDGAVTEGYATVQGYSLCPGNLVRSRKDARARASDWEQNEEKEKAMDYFWFIVGLVVTIAVIGFIKCSSLED